MKVTSFQSSEPTTEIFSKSGQDALFHFVSTCSKKIIHKKINDSCPGFSCSWTSCCGIQRFFERRPFLIAQRDSVRASPAPCHFAMVLCLQCSQARSRDCIEYSTQQHRSARVGIIHQVRSALSRMFHHRRGASFIPYASFFILQQCMVDDLLLVAIGTQYQGSHHKTVLEKKLS